jgi:hypothetical protein
MSVTTNNLSFSKVLTSFTIFLSATTSCSPNVYLIDRQTILEIEASGDWQELDEKFQEKELASGPLPTSKTRKSSDRNRIYRMTHSDQNGNGHRKEAR